MDGFHAGSGCGGPLFDTGERRADRLVSEETGPERYLAGIAVASSRRMATDSWASGRACAERLTFNRYPLRLHWAFREVGPVPD